MYSNARCRVRVGEGYSEEFEVEVDVHQGSLLSPLLSSLCWKPCHVSSAVGLHGRTSMLTTVLS